MNISNNVASITANQTVLNTTANNIANVNTDKYVPKDTIVTNNLSTNTRLADNTGNKMSQTNLSKEIPDLIVEEKVNAVNVNAIKTQDEMFGSLLDIKA
jgi:flagellar hook protein FlgE